MQLRLAVRTAAGAGADVVADVDPAEPLSALLAALSGQTGIPPGQARAAQLERTGRWLNPAGTVAEADLRDGDGLLLAAAGDATAGVAPDPAPFALEVTAGPAAGATFPLAPGRLVLGRGPGAELVVDDPSLSRRHAALDISGDDVTLSDAGSRNGTFLGDRTLDGAHRLEDGEPFEAGRSVFVVRANDAAPRAVPGDGAGGIPFNRPPRIVPRRAEGEIRVPAPPDDVDAPRIPLTAAGIPLVLGVVMYLVTRSPYMLTVAALSPAMVLASWSESRRAGRRRDDRASGAFETALREGVEDAATRRRAEAERLRAAGPGPEELRRRIAERAPELWERRPGDHDVLRLRVGVADRPSSVRVELERGGPAARRRAALAELDEGSVLEGVPVLLPLDRGFAGLAGPPARVAALARWLVAQAAAAHSPGDLRIAAAIAADALPEWDWLKWLPHTRPELLAAGTADGDALLDTLAAAPGERRVLLVCDEAAGLDRRRVAELPESVSVIWLGRAERDLPGQATHVVVVDDAVARLRLADVATGEVIEDVRADGIDPEIAAGLARLLAPLREVGARDERGALPERVSLLDLLGLDALTGASVAEIWRRADEDLGAPLGRTERGTFELEVGQVEGLRLLVAGMPGAGKSELLQSLIASLAASHPPTALSFLLVDYKGGAAFRDVVRLPHSVGLVTDLDEHLAERARVSLLAELRRREELLRAAGAADLRGLRRLAPDGAPPHLVVVVDEFATLGREVPAFVDTLVDVAQRGRSLGIHLILATQRPRGAVSDAIRANTNLRIAMRTSEAAESLDVLEAPDAAAIPSGLPGRAVALAGRRADGAPRLVPFQTAYAGGHTRLVGDDGVAVRHLRFGARAERAERLVTAAGVELGTDLEGIVEAAVGAAERLGLEAPPSPWLPPLPARVALDDIEPPEARRAAFALLDEPERQRRRPLALDLETDGSLIVYGTSGSGKTTLLRALACALARGSSPREVHLYGLDFASRALGDLEALPQCGAVIAGEDEERVARLLGAVRRTMAARRDRLAAGAVDEVARAPSVVLLLDGWAGFAAAYERVAHGDLIQAFTRIAAEGRPLGIRVVVTADRRADVPGALAGVIPQRLVLRTADPDEAVALGLPRSLNLAELPPGRGVTGDGMEFQVALVEADELARIADAAARDHPRERAPRIGRLPTEVEAASLPAPTRELGVVLGLDGERLRPVGVDLADGDLLVAGPHRSGRSTALAALASALERGPGTVPTHLLLPRRSPLAERPGWASTAVGPEACVAALERLAAEPGPLVVVVDDATDLPEGAAGAALETLLRRGRDETVRVVAAVEGHAAQRAYGGWLRELRNEQRGVVLQPAGEADGDLLGVRLPRDAGAGWPPGRGFLITRGAATVLQVARA